MADSSAVPVRRVDASCQPVAKTAQEAASSPDLPSISPAGPRKLIRPHLPADANRYPIRPVGKAAFERSRMDTSATRADASHAEAYYLQKQIHGQTPMIFLLDNGDRIEGTIEWYDRNAIKVRHGSIRTLIYKDGIKYIYKAGEADNVNGRP